MSGKLYQISSISLSVLFNLKEKYKILLEEYIKYGSEYAFQDILQNANIQYIKNI
jgi:hypothetical protein